MLIILRGKIGTGKTSIAKRYIKENANCKFIEIDKFPCVHLLNYFYGGKEYLKHKNTFSKVIVEGAFDTYKKINLFLYGAEVELNDINFIQFSTTLEIALSRKKMPIIYIKREHKKSWATIQNEYKIDSSTKKDVVYQEFCKAVKTIDQNLGSKYLSFGACFNDWNTKEHNPHFLRHSQNCKKLLNTVVFNGFKEIFVETPFAELILGDILSNSKREAISVAVNLNVGNNKIFKIELSFQEIMARLRTNYIDTCILKNFAEYKNIGKYINVLLKFKKNGEVNKFGISINNLDYMNMINHNTNVLDLILLDLDFLKTEFKKREKSTRIEEFSLFCKNNEIKVYTKMNLNLFGRNKFANRISGETNYLGNLISWLNDKNITPIICTSNEEEMFRFIQKTSLQNE